MADLQTVRSNIYTNINRTTSAAMTSVIDLAINSAVELIGHNIPLIYEEEFWERTFTSDDATNKVDNFALPTTTKFIRSCELVDTTTAGEEVYYPLVQVSPDELYDTNKLEGFSQSAIGYTTSTRDISGVSGVWDFNTFRRGGITSIGRASRAGRPELIARVATNVYIHPYIDSDYVGWKLQLLLVMYPDSLSADGDTNTITVRFPHALMHFASGIIWASHFHDQNRAQAEFQLGAQYLSMVARDDQIKKLLNIQGRFFS